MIKLKMWWRTWMLASAKRKRKKMEERGAGKRMLTDCKAISDPPPTHRASIRLDIPLCRTHVLINTQTMLWDLHTHSQADDVWLLYGQKADHCVCIDVYLYCAMHVGVWSTLLLLLLLLLFCVSIGMNVQWKCRQNHVKVYVCSVLWGRGRIFFFFFF